MPRIPISTLVLIMTVVLIIWGVNRLRRGGL
jgi:hypothetical protein